MPQPDFNRTSTPDIGLNTVQFRPLYTFALQPLNLSDLLTLIMAMHVHITPLKSSADFIFGSVSFYTHHPV